MSLTCFHKLLVFCQRTVRQDSHDFKTGWFYRFLFFKTIFMIKAFMTKYCITEHFKRWSHVFISIQKWNVHICIYRYSCKQLCENHLIYKFILVETLYFKKNCTFKWDYWDSLSTLLKDRLDIYTCTYIMKNTLHHAACSMLV